jgi:hypothetical protein
MGLPNDPPASETALLAPIRHDLTRPDSIAKISATGLQLLRNRNIVGVRRSVGRCGTAGVLRGVAESGMTRKGLDGWRIGLAQASTTAIPAERRGE